MAYSLYSLTEEPIMPEPIIAYIDENRSRYIEELKEILRIPSISTSPEAKSDVARCAEFVAAQITAAGMRQVRIFPTDGHPLVYGEWLGAPGKPTVLIYGHYDVQPVDPLELWESPPFEPAIRNGRIYARGAADDKGQIMMHFKALEAHLTQNGCLPVNIKLLIEGEEEIGSDHLDGFIEKNKALLGADLVVISDTAMYAKGVPSICYGLRGLIYYQIDLEGTSTDLHSGSFGGAVINPAYALSRMLAGMKDARGRITIPGFYDDVRKLSPLEKKEFARLRFSDAKLRKEIGAPQLFGEAGYTTLERLWARPTFEINGLLSGFTGEGAKTVISAKAMAKVSMRLVPDQDPGKIGKLFERHLRAVCPKSVRIRIKCLSQGKPWVAPIHHPGIQAATRALQKGFGKRPVFTREGGSIPVVATFAELLKAPSILLGIGLPEENSHAPNEFLDLENYQGGIRTAAHLWNELAGD
jgi:acetylornithine deacetylase/succinyl-diaminopimelate desuccinylase-like protein